MLKITRAEVTPGSAVAEVDAAQAAMRPLAGFGAGAFTCDGAWVGSLASETVASQALLPRLRGAFGATSRDRARAHGLAGGGYQPAAASTSTVSTSTVIGSAVSSKQFNQMVRINPVTPGGLGPHPAREPEPV